LVPEVITDLLKKPARDIITAGSSDQTVPAHSPIPQLLLAALNGEADTYNNGVVSSNEIYSYLLSRVKRDPDIKLTPQYGRLPNPIFAQGQFLFRVAKYDLAPPQEGETTLRQDDREAARLYKLAADQGNASGQANLGVFYENGRGGLPKDDREAARLYKLAADQGDAAGQAGLGIFYSRGRGDVPMDDNEAARLFRLAADQGNANAQTNLGLFYDSARGGLHKDDREAARLYKLAADQGNASAQANLGFFYEEARGGLKQDNDEAERLYKRAADQRSAYTEITTIFELEGAWAATGSPGPKISRSGNALTVDMSAYSRQQASGSVIDPQTIIVTFSDEGTHAGRLWPSGFGTIAWSNRTFWNKLTGSAIPAK
jgi:TPR repeat protein